MENCKVIVNMNEESCKKKTKADVHHCVNFSNAGNPNNGFYFSYNRLLYSWLSLSRPYETISALQKLCIVLMCQEIDQSSLCSPFPMQEMLTMGSIFHWCYKRFLYSCFYCTIENSCFKCKIQDTVSE